MRNRALDVKTLPFYLTGPIVSTPELRALVDSYDKKIGVRRALADEAAAQGPAKSGGRIAAATGVAATGAQYLEAVSA